MLRFSSEQFRRVLVFASIVGFVVGFGESLIDILSGAIIDSRWVRGNFEFTTSTDILYIAFNTALYMLFFQAAGAISALIRIGETRSNILKRFPPNEVLPYWILSGATLGIAVFGNVNETLWKEIDLVPIYGIIAAHLAFIILILLQIRSFQRKTAETASEDPEGFRRKNEAIAAAYIVLAVTALFVPDTSEKLGSPLVRCISLFSVLVFVYPLSRLIDAGLIVRHRSGSGRGGSGRFAFVSAIVAVLIPLCIVLGLARQPTDVSLRSLLPRVSPTTSSARKDRARPNVIILLIDMLRADHVHSYGYERETTPNIDRYAREGVMFSNVRAQSSWTLPSTTTLLSGLYPSTHGATGVFTSISDEAEMMAEVFKRSGYTTAALVSNPVLKRSYNVHQGFDYYCDDLMSYGYLQLATRNACLLAKSLNAAETARLFFSNEPLNVFNTPDIAGYNLLFRPDKVGSEVVNAGALKWIKKNADRPFLLYLHYLDVHGPYMIQQPFEENFAGTSTEKRMNLYDGAVRYTDAQIGLFIEELDRLGILDDSVVLITSDHGEEFGDHGGVTHGYNLFEEQLHIPLVFLRTSAFPFNKTVDEPVGLIDLMPTFVAYLGLEPPEQFKDGRDFSGVFKAEAHTEPPEYQYAETELGDLFRSVIYRNRWKFIWSEEEGRPIEWLYDLSQDESERVNLLNEQPQIAAQLRERLHEAFSQYESRAFTVKTVKPDEKTRHALKALGYIE